LNISLSTVDVLCFAKHWLIEDEITYNNLPNYSLVSQYCRKNKKNWGSGTFEKYNITAKQPTNFEHLNIQENFEASIV
jgi:hypothetical protein